jgi:hypothetical protein
MVAAARCFGPLEPKAIAHRRRFADARGIRESPPLSGVGTTTKKGGRRPAAGALRNRNEAHTSPWKQSGLIGGHQPTAPSICSSISPFSSSAYSMGSPRAIGSTKQQTMVAIVSSTLALR